MTQPSPAVLRVMTFNIRYDNPADGSNAWPQRRTLVGHRLQRWQADLIGLQEVLAHQLDALTELMPNYGWCGVGRDDGQRSGEFAPLFYRRDRLRLQDWGNFWLSETPAQPGSFGWDAVCVRLATWASFTDLQTNTPCFACNTHFDHRGQQAQLESARLLQAQLADLAGGIPFIVTGDFNCRPDSDTYRALVTPGRTTLYDTYTLSRQPPRGPQGTYHGFAGRPGPRIDYIFVSPGWTVNHHATLTAHEGRRYPSDHYPVLADLCPAAG